jgi:D-alanyl-D-alanine carboxypeptidase
MFMKLKRRNRRKKPGCFGMLLLSVLAFSVILGYALLKGGAGQSAMKGTDGETYSLRAMDSADLAVGSLILVSRDAPYSFPDNAALVCIADNKNDDYFIRDKNLMLDKQALAGLNDMLSGFYQAKGLRTVNVVSGSRTLEEQRHLYDQSLEENGAAHTALYVAEPGCSEHHTGLAVDFSVYREETGATEEFSEDGDYRWFRDNAWKYGFILRYPEEKKDITKIEYEPWHYRYVGVPHAWYMKKHELCLEEYLELLRGYPCDGEHLRFTCEGRNYEVYYCSGTMVYVPEACSYTVSGNNTDGFIVTVDKG